MADRKIGSSHAKLIKEKFMPKKMKSEMNDELRPEYDLRRLLKDGVRGKHYKAMQQGYTIKIHKSDGTTVVKRVKPVTRAVILEPDVLEYFPNSEAVNKALRSLIALIPNK
ncbi:hypothetical protein L0337_17265 [candidate division KSB1 bacterium]|nr:hypothetical protein [candidate division KSB1 bacterium]